MKSFLLRIWRSPRLGWVVLALAVPALVTMPFAPWWGIVLGLMAGMGSVAFMYAVVLSPKYVHSPDATHPAQYFKDAAARIFVAQSEIREAIELATVSALDLGHRVQNLQVNHDAQVHLAKGLLARGNATSPAEESLADLSLQAGALLRKQNAQLRTIVETSVSMIKQLQINAIDTGHPEDIQELQGLVTTLREALQEISGEAQVLTARLGEKLEETRETLAALDELTEDTHAQVRDAVIAMQYHDITTQKIADVERVHLAALKDKTLEKLSRLSPGEPFTPPVNTSSPLAQLAGQGRSTETGLKSSAGDNAPPARQEHAVELFH